MACFKIDHVRLCGLAAAVPRHAVSNMELDLLQARDRIAFVRTTGIAERRIAAADMCASDLCFEAAARLMTDLKWEPSSIDILLFVTQTPDLTVPGTASQLQQRLGLGTNVLAIDVNQGCAGYVYGLSIISSMLSAGHLGRALLLVGDTITHTLSPEDKSTVPIFSDAGSATALEYSEQAPAMYFNLQTDGKGYQAICIPGGGSRQPFGPESEVMQTYGEGIRRADQHLAMQGLDVFNFALAEVAPNIRALLDFAGKSLEDADAYVLHQANMLLNESIRRKLGLPAEKFPYSLQQFGNTSSATIPVTMVHALMLRLQQQDSRLVLSGFGVGLSWGSAYLELGPIVCPPMIEC